jgi:hypothetical protein
MKPLIIAGLIAGISTPALAAPFSMVCENPRRSYVVTFDARQHTLVTTAEDGPTVYRVTSVAGHTVSGLTVKGGPSFTAYFSEPMGIVFKNGKFLQTDPCR